MRHGCSPQRRVQPVLLRRWHERKKPAVRAVALQNEVEREHEAGDHLGQRSRPRLERNQKVRRPPAQPALNPCDHVVRVNPIGVGNRFDLLQNSRQPIGQFAGQRLQIVDDRRQCEKSEQRERARHNQQQDQDGHRSVERLPAADPNPRRSLHDGRQHHRKQRGNIEQRQHAAHQPRHVESQRHGEEEHDVSANALLVLCGLLRLRGLIHAFRSLHIG